MDIVPILVDEGVKQQAEELFEEMGLNMSSAVTLFLKAVIRENRIPFEIKADPFYSAKNQARLRAAAADMDARRNVAAHELIEADGDD
ncbi:MAG: type II toxin-antitoxin system RelB/DinJ family antitoxin [bacterium]